MEAIIGHSFFPPKVRRRYIVPMPKADGHIPCIALAVPKAVRRWARICMQGHHTVALGAFAFQFWQPPISTCALPFAHKKNTYFLSFARLSLKLAFVALCNLSSKFFSRSSQTRAAGDHYLTWGGVLVVLGGGHHRAYCAAHPRPPPRPLMGHHGAGWGLVHHELHPSAPTRRLAEALVGGTADVRQPHVEGDLQDRAKEHWRNV